MDKKTEAVKLALEALKKCDAALAEELAAWDIDPPLHHVQEASNACGPAISALREALAEQPAQQPEQEPVAWRYKIVDCFGRPVWTLKTPTTDTRVLESQPLHTSPPAAQQPLTDEDILRTKSQFEGTLDVQFDKFARAIEAKLREKNANAIAAELRRLHKELAATERQVEILSDDLSRCSRLNAELLEALESFASAMNDPELATHIPIGLYPAERKARAAIAKATGEQK